MWCLSPKQRRAGGFTEHITPNAGCRGDDNKKADNCKQGWSVVLAGSRQGKDEACGRNKTKDTHTESIGGKTARQVK